MPAQKPRKELVCTVPEVEVVKGPEHQSPSAPHSCDGTSPGADIQRLSDLSSFQMDNSVLGAVAKNMTHVPYCRLVPKRRQKRIDKPPWVKNVQICYPNRQFESWLCHGSKLSGQASKSNKLNDYCVITHIRKPFPLCKWSSATSQIRQVCK